MAVQRSPLGTSLQQRHLVHPGLHLCALGKAHVGPCRVWWCRWLWIRLAVLAEFGMYAGGGYGNRARVLV